MDYTLSSPESAMSRQATTSYPETATIEPAPPVSNTGVPTGKTEMEPESYGPMDVTALIDALCFTFGDLVSPDAVKDLPEFQGLKWIDMERGDLGYKVGWYADGICILAGGTPGMGTHVRLMGQGCRYLEGRSQFRGWHLFLRSLLQYKLPVQLRDEHPTDVYYSARLTRIDSAVDDTSGRLNLERIDRARKECTISSTYRKGRENSEFDLKTGKNDGYTITFGKRTGDSVIRFYDRGAKLGLPASEGPCIRCELELHDQQAQAFAQALVDGHAIGPLTAGIIRRKIDFKAGPRPDGAGGSDYRAWASARWWHEFLGGVEKMRLGVAPILRTLQKGKDWLMRQASSLLATVVDTGDWDIVGQMMIEGRKKRPKWQQKVVDEGNWSSEVVYRTIEENVINDDDFGLVEPWSTYALT